MNLNKLAGGGAVIALAAFAATAASADILKATYEFDGVIASQSAACAPIASMLPPAGTPQFGTFYYPGAGKTGLQVITPSTGPSGPAVSSVCVGKAPLGGVASASIPLTCYQDTQTGPASSGSAATISYTVTATSVTTAYTVQAVLDLSAVVPGCTLTANGTWEAE